MSFITLKVPTSLEVYSAIRHTHREEMYVFSSYTNLEENGRNEIYTEWKLVGADASIVAVKTTYEKEYNKEVEGTRESEYWLCVVQEES